VISAYFYLRVIVFMYASEGDVAEGEETARASRPVIRVDIPTGVVLFVCAALTLWVGILPSVILDFARNARLIF
jgi:NADH:ubiquinone oxidoreductase subunit 2 (subunit N)